MDLGPRVPGPTFRAETPEATRAPRPVTRLARRRKAAQSGEGVDQTTTTCSSNGQSTDDQQAAVIIEHGSRQIKTKTKMLIEERGKVMREVEMFKKDKEELENGNLSISANPYQETCTDLKQQIKKLAKSLETANNELVSGETIIMILEGERKEMKDQLEKMKKEKKTTSPICPKPREGGAQTESRLDGDALVIAEEQIKILTEERDKAMREVTNLRMELENTPSTSSQGTAADRKGDIKKLEKKLEAANNELVRGESTILILEGQKEELTDQLKQLKKVKKSNSSNCQKVTEENGDGFKQLQELFSEVRSITGLSENVSPEDSVLNLRETWYKHESRYQKLRDRVEGITERKRAAYANTQLLRDAVEKILDVEPGTMEITDLVEKIQDIDHYYALKIDNLNAKLEAKQQSSKEKLQKIRDICRTTATEMDIKFKKKTKVPEFLALFSSVWNKHRGLVTSLDKKLLESDCRIEELESALDQMKEELEQTTTPKEIKKKKKRLLRTIINTMTSDEKLNKIKNQADQINRLEAIQESKHRQDNEVLALHRESNAIKQTNGDLQKKQKEVEEVIVELNLRLDQEKRTVKELRKIIQILEESSGPGSSEVLQHNIPEDLHHE